MFLDYLGSGLNVSQVHRFARDRLANCTRGLGVFLLTIQLSIGWRIGASGVCDVLKVRAYVRTTLTPFNIQTVVESDPRQPYVPTVPILLGFKVFSLRSHSSTPHTQKPSSLE
jgi:hypothetical protein